MSLPMTVLHTADWHLGFSNGEIPRIDRIEDHRRFFSWLRALIVERDVELLLVSGDIFDREQPSSEAMKLYFDFLASLRELPKSVQVIVTAGNHDAARSIAAAKGPLAWVNTTVIGQLTADRSSWEQALVAVDARAEGHPGIVVAAVPFVQAWHLGAVPEGMEGLADSQKRAEHAIGGCYQALSELASERYPGRPRMAMGHLTVGKPAIEDKQLRPIHSWTGVGGLQGLSTEIFGDGYSYVALGHIHRAYAVSTSPMIRYSGTPIALDHQEAERPHSVTLLEVDADGAVRHELVEVPQYRKLIKFKGTSAEICLKIEAHESGELATLLDITQSVTKAELRGDAAIESAIAKLPEPRPIIVRHEKQQIGGAEPLQHQELLALENITPEQLMVRLYELKHNSPPPESILELFRSIASAEQGS